MMQLYEDYKNLNVIDRAFLNDNRFLNMKNAKSFTPNCRVEIEKCTPHNFTQAMAILNQEDVLAIILRAHKRQLLMVSKYDTLGGYSWHSKDYQIVLSPYFKIGYNRERGYSDNTETTFNNAKAMMSYAVRHFYEINSGISKQWDLMVIYEDKDKIKLQNSRKDARHNSVITPNEGKSKYKDYIRELKSDFKARCQRWIDDHKPNANNMEELISILKSNMFLPVIKIKGRVFEKNEWSRPSIEKDGSFNIKYNLKNYSDRTKEFPYTNIVIYLTIGQNLQIHVDKAILDSDYYNDVKTPFN